MGSPHSAPSQAVSRFESPARPHSTPPQTVMTHGPSHGLGGHAFHRDPSPLPGYSQEDSVGPVSSPGPTHYPADMDPEVSAIAPAEASVASDRGVPPSPLAHCAPQ